ncbi:MAG: hypothetical protein SGARI_003057 [Bacillariaceae sp.]
MPKYFETKDWECFAAALASWGFVRFTSGAQEGSFIHRLFVKGRRSICKQMRIQGKAVQLIKSHGQFLGRLHALLCYAKKSGQTSIVSWTKDGKKFTVHDPNAFIGTFRCVGDVTDKDAIYDPTRTQLFGSTSNHAERCSPRRKSVECVLVASWKGVHDS